MSVPSQKLVSDELVNLLLYRVLDVEALTALPAFADHGRDTFDPWLATCRRLGGEVLAPTYAAMDASPPTLESRRTPWEERDERDEASVRVHPEMATVWEALAKAGVVAASRPFAVGGQQLPLTVATFATAYLMAGNLSAYGFAGLTAGAAHLIEAFGDEHLKETYMRPMYEGRMTGTMALTEPQAGSSLADIVTSARPTPEGHYLLRGAKIFISGGDHGFAENIVHLVLARIEGAPPGTKGLSLFVVPKLRADGDKVIANDVTVTGLIHKIGWRGIPSLALSFGDADDCRGWRVGPPNAGLRCMFQMMNEARIMVGVNAAATASVAYHAAVDYARARVQGRPLGAPPTAPPVPLIEHPDVRRMLLRQKAIVDASFCLLGVTARYADLAEHSPDALVRARSQQLLDLLTPIAKTFPAERGFEANALALQVHGGYGYSSEYLPEAWLRDQKLNSIHEGTTGIQSLDLLGRKAMAGAGAAMLALAEDVGHDCASAEAAGVAKERVLAVRAGLAQVLDLTRVLGERGAGGDLEGMLAHATDYLDALGVVVTSWMWLKMEAAVVGREDPFARGMVQASAYWLATELPRVEPLARLCASGERSFVDCRGEWFL
ncbi:MAG: acyl-CoA dehydrogenase [Myxococcales bacterium]|nr:acyl-CoA dehydrogenase [Myxococcales bacterium]